LQDQEGRGHDRRLRVPGRCQQRRAAFLETWIGDDLDDEARANATESLHRLLLENATADGVLLPSATWLITGRRP
jgi:hypothetical protein